MNCYICAVSGDERPAIGSCRHCQAPLCEDHLPEAGRETDGGALWCCSHAYALPYATLPRRSAAA